MGIHRQGNLDHPLWDRLKAINDLRRGFVSSAVRLFYCSYSGPKPSIPAAITRIGNVVSYSDRPAVFMSQMEYIRGLLEKYDL